MKVILLKDVKGQGKKKAISKKFPRAMRLIFYLNKIWRRRPAIQL